jgi:Ca-activated chloride channel homolog
MERFRAWAISVAALTVAVLTVAAPGLARGQAELAAAVPGGDAVHMPLIEETLRVAIDRQFARTLLRQTYQNEQGVQVEGNYTLFAGEDARVEGFAYWNGAQKIVGEVFEADAARAVYEEVTGLGRDPGLLEQTGEGAFSFRVFPIEPGEQKRIEVTYGQWLRQRGRHVEYRAPLGSSRASVTVAIDEDRPVRAVTSPSHAVTVTRKSDRQLEVRVDGARAKSSELVLQYEVEAPDWQIEARVHRDAGHDPYVVVSVAVPDTLERAAAPKDVTLVIDRSGSMGGDPIVQARMAALDLVDRMRPGDRLNIVVFDHEVELLYPAPRAVTEQVRSEAKAYIQRIDSSGGTDIARALDASLAGQNPADRDRPQIVLFLTDGQSDADEALRVAERKAGAARIYTIGVGHGVERPLLSRLAAQHHGLFTFIGSTGAIASKMGRLYEQLAHPVLVGTTLEIEGARAHHRYPRTLPDLYRGDELVVATRLLPGEQARVRLSGRIDGRPFSAERTLALPAEARTPWAGRMWASLRVEELLEDMALAGESEGARDEVVRLALAYRFTTPYTSFLAIPEEELTDGARSMMDDMREHRRRILAANPDAAALSRSIMPPGDPILRVHAPAHARQVTAYFDFGLVTDLQYDHESESWLTRFLVPNDVVDGDYGVRVLVVGADGQPMMLEVPYTIESDEPDFEVDVRVQDGQARLRVAAPKGIRLATVALVSDPQVRTDLGKTRDAAVREGNLQLPSGVHQLRVVVADPARNEADRVVEVRIP